MTVAEQKAARVCPLGKLLVFGSRTGTPPSARRTSLRSGRDRPTAALSAGVDQARFDAGDGQRPHGPRPLGPGVPGPPHRGGRPHQAVVAESGDHLGRAVDGRVPPQRLEPAVDPLVERVRPGRPATRPPAGPGVRESPLRLGRVAAAGPDRRRSVGPLPRPPSSPASRSCGTADGRPAQHHGGLVRDRRRRRGRRPGSGSSCTAATVRGRKSSSRQARSMADHTATAFCRCPRRACSEGSAVMSVGSLRWRSLTCTGRRPRTSWHKQGVDVDPDQLRLLVGRPTGPGRSCSR